MAHRGPDGQGVWRDGTTGLLSGAWRSSISMSAPASRCTSRRCTSSSTARSTTISSCARSSGDSATAFSPRATPRCSLHAWAQWEEDALLRLNGMFAFAIWDEERRRLTLATDPSRRSRCSSIATGDRLTFASDVRALRAADETVGIPMSRRIALRRVREDAGACRDTSSLDVARLPAAHVARLERVARHAQVLVPRAVDVPRDAAGRPAAAARAAARLGPPAAAQRRARRHLAVGWRRLLGGRAISAPSRRRSPQARVHRHLRRLRARRVALRRRGRSRRPESSATTPCGRGWRRCSRPSSALSRPGGAVREPQHLRPVEGDAGSARGGRHRSAGRTGSRRARSAAIPAASAGRFEARVRHGRWRRCCVTAASARNLRSPTAPIARRERSCVATACVAPRRTYRRDLAWTASDAREPPRDWDERGLSAAPRAAAAGLPHEPASSVQVR